MKRLILTGLCLLWTLWAQAALRVELSDTEVQVGQQFKLILTDENARRSGLPDLSPLGKNFNVLGTERSINYSIINGVAQTSSQWVILLSAKRVGQLQIPPIRVDQQESQVLSIDVSAHPSIKQIDNAIDSSEESIKLVTAVSTDKPYVNQEVIYTVKLYTNERLMNADYQEPQLDDALLIPLGNAKRSQELVNNQLYSVEEQRYAIFPQKSGQIRIRSPQFKALVYGAEPRRVNVKGNTIALSVKPMPVSYQGGAWLVAEHVNLTEDDNYYDKPPIEGGSLTRVITIESIGTPAQLIPKLKLESQKGFNVYSDKPQEKNHFYQGKLVGRLTTKFTYLFTTSGQVILPEVKLPYFNPETGKEEVARLPAKTLDIQPSPSGVSQPLSATINHSPEKKEKPIHIPSLASRDYSLAWWIAAFFGLAWLVTLAAWRLQKKKPALFNHEKKTALLSLKAACEKNDPKKARDALLHWAGLQWPEACVLSLGELSKLLRDHRVKKAVSTLSETLYKSDSLKNWQGKTLWQAIEAYQKNRPQKKSKPNSLPPINPL